MAKSRTIILSVSKKTGDVFDAILNSPPKMMPDAKQNGDGSWSFSTPRGNANLKFKHNKNFGILDHLYEDEETAWDVPMRVVPSGDESEVIVTISKPDVLTDAQFDERMREIDEVFKNLKDLIEKS
ncbi:MAG: hypothetical protein GTN97_02050 [Nitrosopumilaceae archaeon]|nr:hypothetical protein [Nitrosopumilaceae archaeon]NIP09934.1 hypothetical protein [Nitrosopumilaceae archaeon]NIS94705.1 hypothetical protein [Nitrosopumilaceae archaeon]